MSSFKEDLKDQFNRVLSEPCSSHLDNHLDEVYPGIFIGGEVAAKNVEMLRAHGITHVLNAAYVPRAHFYAFGIVQTSQEWYDLRGFKCVFKGVTAIDTPGFNLGAFFEEAAEFIDGGLKERGRVFVHCYVGMSRSATFVIVYLMIKEHMRAVDAIALIRKKRACHPNFGFVDQIIELDLKLQGIK